MGFVTNATVLGSLAWLTGFTVPMVGQQIIYRQFGTPDTDVVNGTSAAADGVYVAGYTFGALPGQTSAGQSDVFVRKYDFAGNELWTRQFGTADPDVGLAVSAEGGGVYVAGFSESALPGQRRDGSFLRKYDANGNELWTRQSTFTTDHAVVATPDRVFVAGHLEFNGFLRAYDANGRPLWTQSSNVARFEEVRAVAEGVYAVGASATDGYVFKYDPGGTLLWTNVQAGRFWNAASANEAGVYVAGGFTTDPSPGVVVRRYDPEGFEVWTNQFSTEAFDIVNAVSATAGRVYVGGYTLGALPGHTAAGGGDAYLVILTEP